MSKWLYAALAATTALVPLSGALAQDAAPAAASDDNAIAPGDIVVTASRRAERLQEVPLAVSALGAEQISKGGFQRLTDLQYQFSGLQFGTSPNDAGFRLRGVGSAGGFSSSSEQNVGTVVDNVVVPFGNPINSLGDLERVEVLKGPQGTQFGKNASSGVINITTARPKFDRVSGKAFVSYGELNEVNANAQLNLPLSANAAIGLFGFYRSNDGFLENVVRKEMWGGEKSYGGRAKLLWEPADGLSIYLIADYSKLDRTGPAQLWSINRLPPASPLMNARFGSLAALGITPGFYNTKTAEEYNAYSTDENYGASLEINKELGGFQLTSITAWRYLNEGPRPFAIDGSPVAVFTSQQDGVDQSFLSQELRLTSPAGSAFEFTGGVYASRRKVGDGNDFNRAQLRPAAPFNPFIVDISAGQSNTQTRSDSLAAFIDGKYHLSARFSLIGGLRYQYDWVRASSYSIIDPAFAPNPPGPPVPGQVVFYAPRPLQSDSVAKDGWSGRIGGEYRVAPDVMVFGTLARGYLGPTVTFSGLTGTKSLVNPQTVRDITIGIKSQLFDRAVTFNANVFFDRYKNLQTSKFNGTEFLTENAGGFDANGFEADAAWRVSPELSLTGSFTYSDTKFTDYLTACPTVVKAGYTCSLIGGASQVQAAGEPLSGAPKYAATFGANVKLPINDHLAFDWSGNVYYRSRVQYAVAEAYAFQKGYATIGLNAGLGHPDGNWRIGVFARNLLNQRFQAGVITLPFNDAGGYVNWMTREGQRTLGVSAEMKF